MTRSLEVGVVEDARGRPRHSFDLGAQVLIGPPGPSWRVQRRTALHDARKTDRDAVEPRLLLDHASDDRQHGFGRRWLGG